MPTIIDAVTDSILFFISGLGVFNGLLIAGYFLLLRRPRNLEQMLLGALLLTLSLRIGKSVFYHFIPSLSLHVLQLGLSACLFIGPFLLLHQRISLRDHQHLTKGERNQLLGLLLIIIAVGSYFPYVHRPDAWNPFIVAGIYTVWLLYIFRAAYELKSVISRWIGSRVSVSLREKWLCILLVTNLIICIIFHSVLYFGFPPYISGPIAFSLLFYILLAFLLFSPRSKSIFESPHHKSSLSKINLTGAEIASIEQSLEKLMVEQQLFKDPQLKVDVLARALQIKAHTLSSFLNGHLGKSFSRYVNEHRVKAAAKLLLEQTSLSFEGISREVGFRSRSSFYDAFKKTYRTTPSEYIKLNRKVS